MKDIQRMSWKQFHETGLNLIINQILHIFGWCIVIEFDSEWNPINAYPAKTKFRGFPSSAQAQAYKKVTRYIDENAAMLRREVENHTIDGD